MRMILASLADMKYCGQKKYAHAWFARSSSQTRKTFCLKSCQTTSPQLHGKWKLWTAPRLFPQKGKHQRSCVENDMASAARLLVGAKHKSPLQTIIPTPADIWATDLSPSEIFCVTDPLTMCTSDERRFISSPVCDLSKNAISWDRTCLNTLSLRFLVIRWPAVCTRKVTHH